MVFTHAKRRAAFWVSFVSFSRSGISDISAAIRGRLVWTASAIRPSYRHLPPFTAKSQLIEFRGARWVLALEHHYEPIRVVFAALGELAGCLAGVETTREPEVCAVAFGHPPDVEMRAILFHVVN